jgi:hypothetical protein
MAFRVTSREKRRRRREDAGGIRRVRFGWRGDARGGSGESGDEEDEQSPPG